MQKIHPKLGLSWVNTPNLNGRKINGVKPWEKKEHLDETQHLYLDFE